jgi:hypothetical protein
MPGDRLKLCLFRRVERLAHVLGVVDGGQQPEVTLGIPHDPMLTQPLHKEGHHSLSSRDHIVLLRSMVVHGECQPDPIVSRVAPCRSWRPYLVARTRRIVHLAWATRSLAAATMDSGVKPNVRCYALSGAAAPELGWRVKPRTCISYTMVRGMAVAAVYHLPNRTFVHPPPRSSSPSRYCRRPAGLRRDCSFAAPRRRGHTGRGGLWRGQTACRRQDRTILQRDIRRAAPAARPACTRATSGTSGSPRDRGASRAPAGRRLPGQTIATPRLWRCGRTG